MFRSFVIAAGVNIISIPAFGGIICVNRGRYYYNYKEY